MSNSISFFGAFKVTSFIHRMVETLGSSVFPYLPKALEQLLSESEVLIIHSSLMFFYQLLISACVFKMNSLVFAVFIKRHLLESDD